MAREASWAWSDVAGAAPRVANVQKLVKAGKIAKSECDPDQHQPPAPTAKATKPSRKTGKGGKEKASAAATAAVPADQRPAKNRPAPLATLATIAESEGWTIDEAISEAINALSRHLYGKDVL
jgi:hypothetical protein